MGCSSSKASKVPVDKRVSDDETVSEFLAQDLLFSQLPAAQLLKAASYFHVVETRGQSENSRKVILQRGSVANALYIVVSGKVIFVSTGKDQKERELRQLQPHDKFGEFGVINGASSRVDVVLVGNGVILELPKAALDDQRGAKAFSRLNTWLSSTESAMMAQKLKDVEFMSKIDDDQLQLIARLFHSRILQKGDVLCREGDALDRFFIVAKGSLVLTVQDHDSMFLELTRLNVGDTFGQLALLKDQVANTTVTALEETMVFSLTRNSFEQFNELANDLYTDMKININERNAVSIVSKRKLFSQTLSKDKLHLLGAVARMHRYAPGTTIFHEGSVEPKTFYIVAQGEADVLVNGKAVRTMKSGDYFGEVSLVSDKPHTASVKVSQNASFYCLEISQADFNALFLRDRSVLAEIQIRVLGSNIELKHCLSHPVAQEYFLKQLEKEFAVENVGFWTAADKMESLGKQRFDPLVISALGLDMKVFKGFIQEQLRESVLEIYNMYLAPHASHLINVKAETFDEIREMVGKRKYSYEMFRVAMTEIYSLMERDNFARFKRSPLFEEMLSKIGTYDRLEGIQSEVGKKDTE